MKIFGISYIVFISLVAVIMTVTDKKAAIKRAYRISEKALLCVSALGGGVAMLITMLMIRHKTRHIKFMAGIPFIIILQVIFVAFIANFMKNSGEFSGNLL